MRYKFYFARGTCALATHILLEEVGAEYDGIYVDLGGFEQRSPAYLEVNPKGRVPALVTEAGVLTETPALLAFIAHRFSQFALAPVGDPFAFARVQEFNSYLCSTVHVAHAHGSRGARWVDNHDAMQAMRRKVPETMGQSFEFIERHLLRGPWVMGDAYTICDPYLFTISRWLEGDGVEIARFPKVADHYERMRARPAVQRALEMESSSRGKS